MRRLTLTEFKTHEAIALSVIERDALQRLHPGIRIEPSLGFEGFYDLTPNQQIGIISLPGLVIEIRPKVPISSVLFLVSYACDAALWLKESAEFAKELEVVEMLTIMLARLVQHVTRHGLLHGYRSDENTVQVPRGRILFDEQIKRRAGISPPIEVRHDLFTSDILENRLLLAALRATSRIPFQSNATRREVFRAQRLFGEVCYLNFPPFAVPDVVFTRLNRHYQAAISLATLLLRSASLDIGIYGTQGLAFLIDMNVVFERFVRSALRSALGAGFAVFPDRPPRMALDEGGIVPLQPDLCVLAGERIVWVGDAKYKRLPAGGYRNADLYQLLAYAVGLDLAGGTLIYAADEGVSTAEHVVVKIGKRLQVVALDLMATPYKILHQIQVIAQCIPNPVVLL